MEWWWIKVKIVNLKKMLYMGDLLYMGGGPSLARVRIFGKKIMGPVTILINIKLN
jgi:hypothetical protein